MLVSTVTQAESCNLCALGRVRYVFYFTLYGRVECISARNEVGFKQRSECHGDAENAELENAGLENSGPKCRGGKRRTGKRGTIERGWKTQDWKT